MVEPDVIGSKFGRLDGTLLGSVRRTLTPPRVVWKASCRGNGRGFSAKGVSALEGASLAGLFAISGYSGKASGRFFGRF